MVASFALGSALSRSHRRRQDLQGLNVGGISHISTVTAFVLAFVMGNTPRS